MSASLKKLSQRRETKGQLAQLALMINRLSSATISAVADIEQQVESLQADVEALGLLITERAAARTRLRRKGITADEIKEYRARILEAKRALRAAESVGQGLAAMGAQITALTDELADTDEGESETASEVAQEA